MTMTIPAWYLLIMASLHTLIKMSSAGTFKFSSLEDIREDRYRVMLEEVMVKASLYT